MIVNLVRISLTGTVAVFAGAVISPAAQADPTGQIACSGHIDITVNFTPPATAHGTITFENCVSLTNPEIVSGIATINGSASGTPSNVTITEADQVTWKNAAGSTVATSHPNLTRKFIGASEIAMAETITGIVVEGLFEGANVAGGTGVASRSCADNTCVYSNDDFMFYSWP